MGEAPLHSVFGQVFLIWVFGFWVYAREIAESTVGALSCGRRLRRATVRSAVLPRTRFPDFSQVDMLGLQYKSGNLERKRARDHNAWSSKEPGITLCVSQNAGVPRS